MNLVLMPVLVPLATALLAVMAAGHTRQQAGLSLLGALLTLGASLGLLGLVWPQGNATLMAGHWPSPYGIALAADGLGAALVAVASLLVLVTLIALQGGERERPLVPCLHSLIHLLLAGVNGAFLTADLFNLYVWFELVLMAALGLLVAGGQRVHLEAAFKYFALNMLGTLLLLAAVALIYGVTGQLNFEALRQAASQLDVAGPLSAYLGVLVLALLMKAAAFPLFAWLPATYHSLPAPLLALFGGLLTKVGVYALLRLLGDVFQDLPSLPVELLGGIALATMVSGVLGAAYHWDLRRILAFHIVSQIGYMLLGIALMSPAGAAATLVFTLHNILVKAALFLIAGQIWLQAGHFDLRRVGGLYPARPGLALLFLLAAFSLVGLPPTSGFWGKFLLVSEAFTQGRYLWGGMALAVGALTLYSMVKIWLEAFWKPHPAAQVMDSDPGTNPDRDRGAGGPAYLAIALLLGLSVVMGLWPEAFISGAQQAMTDFGGGRIP